MWKQVKPGLIRVLYWVKCGFINENFNLQMDFMKYAEFLREIENPDETRLENIHRGIEEFRVLWERYCDQGRVAYYVKQLYEIHNSQKLDFEVTVQGILMESDKK
jgi:hypothetical protein